MSGRAAPLGEALSQIALPAFALGAGAAAIISRVVRAALLEALGADFVRTGYAKGLGRARVVLVHALRNAMLPVISVIGLRFGALLGRAVLTETVFNWSGMGSSSSPRSSSATFRWCRAWYWCSRCSTR